MKKRFYVSPCGNLTFYTLRTWDVMERRKTGDVAVGNYNTRAEARVEAKRLNREHEDAIPFG